MKINFLFLFTTLSVLSYAQGIQINGTVFDRTNNLPLQFATAAIVDSEMQVLAGSTTDEAGQFILTTEKTDTIRLSIHYIGFYKLDTIIPITSKENIIWFKCFLTASENSLDEIIISGERTTSNLQMDKQTFNAGQLGNSTSGTALDIVQKLPSVTVNTDGEILMRGNASLLVTVNGKFSNQTAADVLAMIPANMIERIEVISSPSANFDAEGKAGIINIVTKSDSFAGWGFIINGNFSSIDPQRYGGDFTLYNSGKLFNTFLSANYRQYNIGGERNGEIRTIYNDTVTYSPSSGERPTEEKIYGVRAGTSFIPAGNQIINAAAYYGYRENIRYANLNYDEYTTTEAPLDLNYDFDAQLPDRSFYNQNVFSRTGEFFTLNLDYAFTFANASKIVFASAYEHSVLGGPLTNQDTDNSTGEITLMERSDEVSPLNAWRLQCDYSIPVHTNMQLETGVLWRKVHHNGDFIFERLNLNTQIWETDPEFSDTLDLTQSVYAGYLQLNGKFGIFSFNAGLRAEQMDRTLTHALDSVPANLNQFDLFPSVQALLKLQKAQSLKLSFAKRINRPTTKALAPFKNHRHSEAIWIGDPNLLPELSYNLELGYEKKMESVIFSVLTYYYLTENMIFRVNDAYNRITLYTITTNAGNSKSAGIEFTSDLQLTSDIRFYFSGNVYHFYLYDLVNAETTNTESINYNIYANFSYRFLPKFKFEWNATYISETVTAQGDDSPLFLSDVSLKYMHSDRLSFDLMYQNVFNSNRQTIHTSSSNFISTTEYVKYDNIIQLTISYKLNNLSSSNKNVKTEYGEKDF